MERHFSLVPMQLWQRFCTAAGTEASNDDIIVICAGMLTVGVGAWSFLGNSQSTRSAKTQVERILADDPALKLVTEKSSYMRTER